MTCYCMACTLARRAGRVLAWVATLGAFFALGYWGALHVIPRLPY